MNIAIFIIFVCTLFELNHAASTSKSSQEQLWDIAPLMQMLQNAPDFRQLQSLFSFGSPSSDSNDFATRPSRIPRTPRTPSRLPRTPSRSFRTAPKLEPRRTKSSSSSPKNTKTPEMKVGTTVLIDDQGNVTVDDRTLYTRHPQLKLGQAAKLVIRDGIVTINDVPILQKSNKNGNMLGSLVTSIGLGAKWMKINVLSDYEIEVLDNRGNIISQYV